MRIDDVEYGEEVFAVAQDTDIKPDSVLNTIDDLLLPASFVDSSRSPSCQRVRGTAIALKGAAVSTGLIIPDASEVHFESDIRVRLRSPNSLGELAALWWFLREAVLVPIDVLGSDDGFIATVISGDASSNAEYRHVPLDIRRVQSGGPLSNPQPCLIRASRSHFLHSEKMVAPGIDLDSIGYFFVHVLDGPTDIEGGRKEYHVFIIPVESGQWVGIESHARKGSELLGRACQRWNPRRPCSSWDASYDNAFPELSRIDGIPDSATFKELGQFLDVLEELQAESAIVLPLGSVPVRRGTLVVVVAAVVVIQVYLWLAVVMVIRAAVYPSNSFEETVPWIALYEDPALSLAWGLSLAFPVVGILATSIWLLAHGVSGGGVFEFGAIVLMLLISVCVAFVTFRLTPALQWTSR